MGGGVSMLRSEFSAGLDRIKIKSVEVVTSFKWHIFQSSGSYGTSQPQRPLAVVLTDR